MSFQPSPQQTLALFGMLFGRTPAEREPMKSKLQPKLSTKARDQLVKAGFVELERRSGRAEYLVLTERAWDWAANHLTSPLMQSKFAANVLEGVLTHVARDLEARGSSLAGLVTAEPQPSAGNGASELSPAERVRRVALALAGGAKRRVRLAELRRDLADMSRAQLDALLLDMQEQGQLVLYRLDNPTEVTDADRAAALLVAGNPRHLVYLEA